MSSEPRSDTDALDGRGPVVVVEPHGDDAFISLGSTIEAWIAAGRSVEIVTVFWPEPHRAREAKAWAELVGAGWRGLAHDNRGRAGGDVGPSDDLLAPLALSGDVTEVWPLGVGHPDHRFVGGRAPAGALRYVDAPYAFLPPLIDEVSTALRGRRIESWALPAEEKWRGIDCFGSQHGLFDVFGDLLRRSPEILVV